MTGTALVDLMGFVGFFYFSNIVNYVMNQYSSILIFYGDRAIFAREYANKMYQLAPFYLSKQIVELPVQVITAFLYTSITYFGVGLTIEAGKFFGFFFVIFLNSLFASSNGSVVASIFSNPESAINIV